MNTGFTRENTFRYLTYLTYIHT